MPAMVDSEVIAVHVLMLGQVRSAVKFDARGIRAPSIPKYDLVDPGEMAVEWKFFRIGQSRVTRHYIGIVPEKIEDWQSPFFNGKTAVAQKPRSKGVFEAVDGIS